MELSARNARPALPPVLRSLSFSPVSSLFLDIHILQPPIIFAVIVMRDFFGSFLHNFLLLLPPLLSYSLPADLGTARLLSLESDIKEVQERWRQYRNIVTDGFFLNDSMIVLADFFGGQHNGEEEQDEESDVDYHHYFSFQDYMTDSVAPVNIRGLETNDIATKIDTPENFVGDIVGLDAGTIEKIKMNPDIKVVAMNNDPEDEWNSITENSNSHTEMTERQDGLSEMINDNGSLNGRPMSSEEEQLVTLPGGKGGGNKTKDDTSKLDGDGLDKMETNGTSNLEPVDEDGEALEQVEMDGKGLEQVTFTQAGSTGKTRAYLPVVVF